MHVGILPKMYLQFILAKKGFVQVGEVGLKDIVMLTPLMGLSSPLALV